MKIKKPKEIIYVCDMCGRRFGKGEKSGVKKLKIKNFYEFLKNKPKFYPENIIICKDCYSEMKRYLRQKIRGE